MIHGQRDQWAAAGVSPGPGRQKQRKRIAATRERDRDRGGIAREEARIQDGGNVTLCYPLCPHRAWTRAEAAPLITKGEALG